MTDALDALNQTQCFEGTRYDVGDKFGFITTNINYGLTHPEVKDKLKDFIIALGKELSGEKEEDVVTAASTIQTV